MEAGFVCVRDTPSPLSVTGEADGVIERFRVHDEGVYNAVISICLLLSVSEWVSLTSMCILTSN